MSKEIRTSIAGGMKVETTIAPSINAKLEKEVKRLNTSKAQVLRDLLQEKFGRKRG